MILESKKSISAEGAAEMRNKKLAYVELDSNGKRFADLVEITDMQWHRLSCKNKGTMVEIWKMVKIREGFDLNANCISKIGLVTGSSFIDKNTSNEEKRAILNKTPNCVAIPIK
jgi:hypothetical protein